MKPYPIPKGYILAVVAFSVVLSLVCSLHQGIGLTHDSGAYMYGAYTLASTGTMLDYFGMPMVVYPPLYSFVLSASYYLNIDIYVFAAIVNAFAYGLLVWISHLFFKRIFTTTFFYGIAFLWVAFSTPLFMNSVFFLADIIGIVLSYLSFWYFIEFITKKQYGYLLLAAFFGVLCYFQRIIGVTVLVLEGLYLLFLFKERLYVRIKSLFLVFVFSITPLLLWLARNKALNGTLAQKYDPPIKGVWANTLDCLDIASSFILPFALPFWIRVVVLLIPLLYYLYKKTEGLQFKSLYLQILVGYIIVYCASFVLLDSYYFICEFDDRYISPVYIGCIALFFILMEQLWIEEKVAILRKGIVLLVVVLSFFPVVRLANNFYRWYTFGAGYHSLLWKNDEGIIWLKSNLLQEKVYTDNPMPLNLLCRPAFIIPPKSPAEAGEQGDFYFVKWKGDYELYYAEVSVPKYKEMYTFTVVKDFEKCTVYLLHKK